MIVSRKHYNYLRNKFDLLTNELVKANIDLSNNINYVSYMKPQDVQDILWGEAEKIQYEDIIKALVKTIKFYEQADLTSTRDKRTRTERTCDRLASYITKLERENEELKEQNERYEIDNKNLCETAERLNKRNDALENEISEISVLFNEKVDTIIKRDNEIDALKHMLDREEW